LQLDMTALREMVEGCGLLQKQTSVSWIFPCPRCNTSEKLYIRKRDGRFVCWKCKGDGYEGRPEFCLTDLLGKSIKEIRTKLYGLGDLPWALHFELGALEDFWGEAEEDEEIVTIVPKTSFWPLDYYEIDHEFGARGREYLAGRGIDLALAKKYGLRYCPVEQRVIFPVTFNDALVGWQKRAIFPTKFFDEEEEKVVEIPKILSSKGLSGIRENCVMFEDKLKGSQARRDLRRPHRRHQGRPLRRQHRDDGQGDERRADRVDQEQRRRARLPRARPGRRRGDEAAHARVHRLRRPATAPRRGLRGPRGHDRRRRCAIYSSSPPASTPGRSSSISTPSRIVALASSGCGDPR
jgi:hypothetical protein